MAERRLIEQLFGDAGLGQDVGGWPSQVRVAHGSPERLPALFRHALLEDVERLADHYRGPLSFGRGLRSPQTFDSHANAASLLKLGLTVFFQDLSSSLPGTDAFLRQLERELGVSSGCARLSAFASAQDDGVSCHYDAEEVISIQLSGRKTFHVAPMSEIQWPYGAQFGPDMVAVENLYEQARDGFPDATQACFERHEMRPGSVLFLPRGTWHRTEAEEASLSLSIVIRPPVLADALLNWLRPWLIGDARWRLPLYGNVETHEAHLQPLLAELSQRLLEQAEAPILSWSANPAVDSTDLLRVPGARLVWQPVSATAGTPQRVRLQAWVLDQHWRERMTLDTQIPATLVAALDWIEQRQRAFHLSDLRQQFPRIQPDDLRQLLDLLLKAHALRQLVVR